MSLIFRSLIVLALTVSAGAAETIAGRARVVDGDTLAIGGETVRLFGVDAPERDQTCDRDGQPWACGQTASEVLAEAAGKAKLRCEVQDRDRYGRAVAICWAGGTDLGEVLVTKGAALAYQRYSLRYVPEETVARARRVGIWGAAMLTPEEYRHGAPGIVPDSACPIKGNIGTRGRIYHVPGQADYAATRINEAKGEGWFCSETAARRAGFRKAAR